VGLRRHRIGRPRHAATGRLAAATAALAVLLAGCGGGSPPAAAGGAEPRRGGVLVVAGTEDVAAVDPAAATRTPGYVLLRAVSRQLLTYPAVAGPAATTAVPDLAEALPERGADGRTYTLRIRAGARWNTVPQRQITAADAVRGIERSCYPGRPARSPVLLADVLEGLSTFCAGLAAVPRKAAAIRAYLADHKVPGLRALDERTLRIRVTGSAADLPDLLAQPDASPMPVEALDAVPGTAAGFVASGPYRITRHDPGRGYTLERNPAWTAETDPVRKAWVDRIEIVLGADADVVQRRLEDASADLAWDTTVPVERARALAGAGDSRLAVLPTGGLDPYLAINVRSATANGALGRVEVRRALDAAANKAGIAALVGGAPLAEPAEQALTPPVLGFGRRPGASPDHTGDPALARILLRRAGHPDGLGLRLLYRAPGEHAEIAVALRDSMKRAGIALTLVPVGPAEFYDAYLADPKATRAGRWDLALAGWGPDWFGAAGRSMLAPLVDGRRCGPDSVNYACFSDSTVDASLKAALAAPFAVAAAPLWAALDAAVGARVPFVPLRTRSVAVFRSDRVRGAVAVPFLLGYDPTNVWIDDHA
jgi:peptide/nickel transport system substrate-binding protein